MDSLVESATARLNAESRKLREQGIAVINLTVGELDEETPPYIARGVAKHLHKNKYTPTLGLPELRTAIADEVRKKYRSRISADNIAVTAGVKQALYNAFQLICNPGDEVIIPTPCWVSYEHHVTLAGATPVYVPSNDDFSLDVPAIARAITKKTKAIIINSPHNPTGVVYGTKELRALAKALEGKNIFVIADDIYDTLVYTGTVHPITTFFKDKSRLIIVNGFSKSHALTGWRIGYMVAEPDIINANNRLQSHTSGNASVISQLGALESYKRSYASGIRKKLARKRAIVEKHFARTPGVSFQMPQGAFYFFVDVRKLTSDSVDLCEHLLRSAHVAVVPGEAFHAPGFFRMSFALGERELVEALTRIHRFFEKEASHTRHG